MNIGTCFRDILTSLLLLVTPVTTIESLRVEPSLLLPASLVAGEFISINSPLSGNIRLDLKKPTQISKDLWLIAPKPKTFGSSSHFYYWAIEGTQMKWWSRAIPINEPFSRDSAFKIPQSVLEHIEAQSTEFAEEELLIKLAKLDDGMLNSKCFDLPIKSKITAHYAEPRLLPSGKFYHHLGLDQRARPGTPVRAVANGIVALAREFRVPGRMVALYHGGAIVSKYMHLSEYRATEGEVVEKGQVIGLSGNSGRSLAPHLHWEIAWRGIPLNPNHFLRAMEPICDPK